MDKAAEHMQILTGLNETYIKKNADYGGSFDNSLDKYGLIAAAIRLGDKSSRLDSLVGGKKAQVLDESIEDTLLDMANYAVMTVMWLRNKDMLVDQIDYRGGLAKGSENS